MKLRLKTVMIIAVAMAGIFILLSVLSYDLIVGRFERLEKEAAVRDMERVGQLLQGRLDDLAGVAMDNGKWDDSCRFLDEYSEKYVKEVVTDTSTAHKLDVWLMFDQEGHLAYGKAFLPKNRNETELPQDLKAEVEKAWPSMQQPGSGLLFLREGALLLGYHTIESSDGSGPKRGVLAVGRYLQGTLLEELARQAQLEIMFRMVHQPQLSENLPRLLEKEGDLIGFFAVSDLTGQGALELSALMSRTVSRQGHEVFYYFLASLLAVLSIVLLIVFFLLEKTVLKRLLQTTRLVQSVKSQDDCRKRLPEQGDDELAMLAASINTMLKMLEESFNRVQSSNNALGNLLNNAGQGILSFSENRLVDADYSVECLRFFSGGIAQKDICDLLFPGESLREQEERNFLAHALQRIFNESDDERRNVFISLLPDEVMLAEKTLEIRYKIIFRLEAGAPQLLLMLIMTDVTEKRQLEKQFQIERKVLQMVITSRLNYNDLSECIQEFRVFCRRELPEALDEEGFGEKSLAEILHYIHTFKGKFAQFNLIKLDEELHKLEQDVIDLRESGAAHESYRQLLSGERLQGWLDEDIRLLKRFLGERFFAAAEMFTIPKQELLSIEKKVLQNMSRFDSQWLLPLLRRLRYRPFADLLSSYPEYAATMAERLGRQLAPMKIDGGETLINPQHYRGFANSLVHVIKNALEHGLEEPDERLLKGKNEKGVIRCSVRQKEGRLLVSLGDDGRGLDLAKIKDKAREKDLFSREELDAFEERKIFELIFHDDFTTRETVSTFSGRGIGLAAVKKEVDKLGGMIRVENHPGKGTDFFFSLPFDAQDSLTPQVSFDAVLRPLAEAAREYLGLHAGLEQVEEKFSLLQNSIRLSGVAAFIAVKGSLQGTFIMSLNQDLLQRLTEALPGEVKAALSEAEIWEGVVAESANVILGNSLILLPTHLKSILIDTPITLQQQGEARVGYPNREIWSCRLSCGAGTMEIFYVALEEKRVNDA